MRDLLRCREDIRADLLRARHRLSKFLLRHGRRFTGDQEGVDPRARRVAARAEVAAAGAAADPRRPICAPWTRRAPGWRAVETDLQALPARSSRCATRARRLRCFRGIDDLTALTIAAELSDRAPLSRPRRSVMAYVGLVPSEHSSGTKRARGGDHQDGQCPSPPGRGRSGLALPPSPVRGQRPAPAAARAHRRRSVTQAWAGAAPAASALSAAHRRGANRNSMSSRRSPAS